MKETIDYSRMPVERWKEAVKAGSNDSNYRRENGYTMTKDDFFVDGVQWADEHPKKGLVDLNEVWHEAEELPVYDHKDNDHNQILVIGVVWMKNGCYPYPCHTFTLYMLMDDGSIYAPISGYRFEWNASPIGKWAYLKDILPSKVIDKQ